jgi:hypothetical protein
MLIPNRSSTQVLGTVSGLLYGLGAMTVYSQILTFTNMDVRSKVMPRTLKGDIVSKREIDPRNYLSTGALVSSESVSGSMSALIFGVS